MNDRNNKNKNFEAYPRPTEVDKQLKNQPEYLDDLAGKDPDKTDVQDDRTKTGSTQRDSEKTER